MVDLIRVEPDSAGAHSIEIRRLRTVSGVWVKASDAARRHDVAVRQRVNSKPEAARGPVAPPQPVKKWVSASEAARRASNGRKKNVAEFWLG